MDLKEKIAAEKPEAAEESSMDGKDLLEVVGELASEIGEAVLEVAVGILSD